MKECSDRRLGTLHFFMKIKFSYYVHKILAWIWIERRSNLPDSGLILDNVLKLENSLCMKATMVFSKILVWKDFPGDSDSKGSAYNAGDPGSIAGLGRSPGEVNGNSLQYYCLEKSYGQRNLVGYSPWGRKESDMTERLHFSMKIFHGKALYPHSLQALWYGGRELTSTVEWSEFMCLLLSLFSIRSWVIFLNSLGLFFFPHHKNKGMLIYTSKSLFLSFVWDMQNPWRVLSKYWSCQ